MLSKLRVLIKYPHNSERHRLAEQPPMLLSHWYYSKQLTVLCICMSVHISGTDNAVIYSDDQISQ